MTKTPKPIRKQAKKLRTSTRHALYSAPKEGGRQTYKLLFKNMSLYEWQFYAYSQQTFDPLLCLFLNSQRRFY